NIPYHIIPGNHDTKWSESGCTKFAELWGDDKFFFEQNGTIHVGLNSGVYWRGGGGHVSPEDLNWLVEKLKNVNPNQGVIFYIHHPLDGDVDNWFKVTNILRNYDVKAVMLGHGHSNRLMNFNGIPAAMGRSTLSKTKSWGYNLVSETKDSLLFFEVNNKSAADFWGGIAKNNDTTISKIDSLQFINYDVNLLWKKELNVSMSASLFPGNDKLFAVTKNGMLHCYTFDGKELWKYNTHGTVFSRPVQNRDIVAVGTIEGDLLTINVNTGETLQLIGIGEPITSQLISYDLRNNGKLTAGVIVGTANGNLFCYDLYSLELIWENHSAEAMIETLPLFVNDKIIFGSWDNYLYCVDANTGALNWKWTENKNFYYSPAACWAVTDGKYVYVSTPDKFISAVDLLQGTTVWRKNNFVSWESIGITGDGKNLLIKSFIDKFY
ncbi:MAG: PQQ-binding-like beta-propeller repeat protein, partial [Ignavibacteriaceae bacterium]|nr:PQQ-binding-like beta-propeller repeat protein [Ignavibacteriaceae bacterium]